MSETNKFMKSYWTKELKNRIKNGSSEWKINLAKRKLKELK